MNHETRYNANRSGNNWMMEPQCELRNNKDYQYMVRSINATDADFTVVTRSYQEYNPNEAVNPSVRVIKTERYWLFGAHCGHFVRRYFRNDIHLPLSYMSYNDFVGEVRVQITP